LVSLRWCNKVRGSVPHVINTVRTRGGEDMLMDIFHCLSQNECERMQEVCFAWWTTQNAGGYDFQKRGHTIYEM
jgi:hypothetical protein